MATRSITDTDGSPAAVRTLLTGAVAGFAAAGALALLARITHLALHAFLLAQPLLGILPVNLSGDAVTLPGGWSLPMLVRPDHPWHERVAELREVVGKIFYWVIGLHVAAALWHDFVARDRRYAGCFDDPGHPPERVGDCDEKTDADRPAAGRHAGTRRHGR